MPSQKGNMAAFSTSNTVSGVGIHSRPGGGNASHRCESFPERPWRVCPTAEGVARVRVAPGNEEATARTPTRGAREYIARETMGSAAKEVVIIALE
jgi:hypothetical protein